MNTEIQTTKTNEIRISIKSSQFVKTIGTTNFDLLYTAIQRGFWKIPVGIVRTHTKGSSIYNDHKSSLPMFYMVHYKERDQGVGEGIEFTSHGLMIFDIDVYDEEPVQEAIKWVRKNLGGCLFMMFRSPSNGLKFIIKTDLKTNDFDYHKFAYKTILEKFQKSGLAIEIDDKTCNVNRGTYASYDPDAYYNPDCSEFACATKARAEYDKSIKQEMERRAAVRTFISTSEFDEKYARNSLNLRLESLFAKTFMGGRNSAMYQVSATCFDCGFDIQEAYTQLQLMRERGVDDPDVKDLWKAAERHHRYWTRKGNVANPKYYKGTPEAEAQKMKSRIQSIFNK